MSDLFDLDASYEGGLQLAKRRVLVQLSVSSEGLTAKQEGEAPRKIRWAEMRLSRGGSSGKVIFCSNRNASILIDCEAEGFLRALEGAGSNELADELARLEGTRVSSRSRHRLLWIGILVLLAATLWMLPKAFRVSIDAVVSSLPYSIDETIGEAVVDEMPVEGALVKDEVVIAALQEMIDRLSPYGAVAEAKYTLRVIESDVINAFALPGGYMTVFTGLLRNAERPEQVAGVIAHEMAHVNLRHGLSRVAHSLGIMVGVQLVLGDAEGLLGVATELFSMATVNGYSREQESEADAEGVRMLIAAQIDPAGLADFFALLEREEGDASGGMSWMSTHPEHRERIRAIDSQISRHKLFKSRPFDFDWDAVCERLEP